MFPVQNNIQVLFCNKEIFDKFVVDYPQDGMTWDEILSMGDKITRKDGDKLYFGFSNQGVTQVIKLNPISLTKVDPDTGKLLINQDPGYAPIHPQFKLMVVSALNGYANRLANGELDLNTALRMAEEDIQKRIDEALMK